MYSGDETYGDDVTSGPASDEPVIKTFDRPIVLDPNNSETPLSFKDEPTDPVTADDKVIMLDITPEYSQTARFMAFQLAEHGFDNRSYGPVASLIEQIAYLTQNEPETVKKLIDDLTFRGKKVDEAFSRNTPKPIVVHYHDPVSMDSYPILCTHCGAEIELIDNRWELAPDGDIEDWDNETGHN